MGLVAEATPLSSLLQQNGQGGVITWKCGTQRLAHVFGLLLNKLKLLRDRSKMAKGSAASYITTGSVRTTNGSSGWLRLGSSASSRVRRP